MAQDKTDVTDKTPEPTQAKTVWDFPGLFEKDSPEDEIMLQREAEREGRQDCPFRLAGDWVRYGVLSEDEFSYRKMAMPLELLDSEAAEIIDSNFLSVIDYRLRFCRKVLSDKYALVFAT